MILIRILSVNDKNTTWPFTCPVSRVTMRRNTGSRCAPYWAEAP